MLHELLKTVVEHSHAVTMAATAGTVGAEGAVVCTSTGTKYIKNCEAPFKLLRWGFLVSAVALVTGGTNLKLTLNFYPTAGSTAGVVALDTLTVVDPNSAFVLGTGAYRDGFTPSVANVVTPVSEVATAGPVGSVYAINAGQTQFIWSVGTMLGIDVTTAATTSGSVELFIEYVLLPISKPSGYGTTQAGTVSLTEQYTRLAV